MLWWAALPQSFSLTWGMLFPSHTLVACTLALTVLQATRSCSACVILPGRVRDSIPASEWLMPTLGAQAQTVPLSNSGPLKPSQGLQTAHISSSSHARSWAKSSSLGTSVVGGVGGDRWGWVCGCGCLLTHPSATSFCLGTGHPTLNLQPGLLSHP